jgi:S1-C subfamily serine protease
LTRSTKLAVVAFAILFVSGVNLVRAAGLTQVALARVDESVVDVNVTRSYQGATGAGSGILLSAGGEVVTNNHVVAGATSISVVDFADGRTFSATVVGYDRDADVALLKLSGARHLRRAPLGSSARLRIGDPVTAVGNAGGLGGKPSATSGALIALSRSITAEDEFGSAEALKGLLETSAPLQPGDSGGPLVSAAGRVIGMDTAGSSRLSRLASAVGYAIPINTALRLAREIEDGRASGAVHVGPTAFLGAVTEEAPYLNGGSVTQGPVVTDVIPGTPAAQVGLVAGDVLTSFADTQITSNAAMTDLLIGAKPGMRVELGWVNEQGSSMTSIVTLGSGPPQ